MAKTIVGELIDLYVKFGGDKSTLKGDETTAEMIDAIEQIYHDNGDTLPTVTADDNGKVLSVVNGEWDKADAENNNFLVTYEENDGEYSCDKTFSQIAVAIQANKNVYAKLGNDFYNLVSLDTEEGVKFSQVVFDNANVEVTQIAHDTTNDIQLNVVQLTPTV